MDCYNVSLHGFFSLFLWFFFSKWSLSILFFSYWAGWEFCFVVFKKKTLWIATMFPYMVFVLLQYFPTCFFSKLFLLIFFYIELVKNLVLTSPTCFISHFFSFSFFAFFFQNCLLLFFMFFFSKLFLLILFF